MHLKVFWKSILSWVFLVFIRGLYSGLEMHINEFQQLISEKYEEHDRQRGTAATFMWFIEEVGELATALASGSKKDMSEEFADVLAWLFTLANINDIDLQKACKKYASIEAKKLKPK